MLPGMHDHSRSRRHPARSRLVVGLLALTLLAVGACGGGGDGADDDGSASGGEGGARDEQPAVDGSCGETALDFTSTATGASGTATSAVAVTRNDGALYNVYVADYELTEADVTSFYPEVPDGANVVLVQFTVFNASGPLDPIAAGTEVDWAVGVDDGLTFLVGHLTDDERFTEATNDTTEGRVTVTGVGERLCLDIDYRDEDKEVSGTVAATVVSR